MNVILVAIGSRYIHKNLGVLSIYEYVKSLEGYNFSVLETSINEPLQKILQKLLLLNPEIIGFSTYIWNKEMVLKLAETIKRLKPSIKIVLGGPEIDQSYETIPYIDCGIIGEGETLFKDWLEHKTGSSKIIGPSMDSVNIEALPFSYSSQMEDLENKIIYYEGSRGCPFKCSYCLSGRR